MPGGFVPRQGRQAAGLERIPKMPDQGVGPHERRGHAQVGPTTTVCNGRAKEQPFAARLQLPRR